MSRHDRGRAGRVALWRVLLTSVIAMSVAMPTGSADRVVAAGPTVSGIGSSFAGLEMSQWTAEVGRDPYELAINYSAQGSSVGRLSFISNSHDFGASDIPFTAQELPQVNRPFAYVPVSAGGLGFMYNLKDTAGNKVTNLNLTRELVCRIFTENGMLWNDAEVLAVNPTLALPAEQIRPIVRSDGSGTSYVLSEYCQNVAPQIWQAFVDRLQSDPNADADFKANLPTSLWPSTGSSQAAATADGVSAAVADPSGLYAITYNEAGYAEIRNFPNANVQNAANQFTQPTELAVTTALGYATARPDGTFQLEYNGSDPAAYFPSTYSYVIAPTDGYDPAKGAVLAKFLCYAVTYGQRVDLIESLHYARLSAPLVDIARNAIAKIPGAPPWDECKVESAPPPPAIDPTGEVIVVIPSGGSQTGGSTGPTGNPAAPAAGAPAAGAPTADGSTAGGSTGAGASNGSTTGSATTGGSTTGGSSTGGSSTGGGAAATGGSSPAGSGTTGEQTQVSIDPVTGESIVVSVTVPASESGCSDPTTGLPADPSTCAGAVAVGNDSAPTGAAPLSAAPPKVNPQVGESSNRPETTQIVWWLAQGAGVCAIGVALAGVRKRAL